MTDLAVASHDVAADDIRALLSPTSLRRFGGRTALITDDGAGSDFVSFEQLADRVEERRDELGSSPRLVLVEAANDTDTIVSVLAALDGRHAVMLAERGRAHDVLDQRYAPDTVVMVRDGRTRLDHRTSWADETRHDLHPDLAMLSSTSGSTGGSKLVRLSDLAVRSNAAAIAESLGLTRSDRAIASLPLHYCYGLSVITSHLAVGASIVLTDASIVDPCFWRAIDRWEVTTLAGVPYSFEMVDRLGEDVLHRQSLRIVTQAGGRMEPEAIRRLSQLGANAGWGFTVMYGQTEATARIAVLPAAEVANHPNTVGRPIPGGSIRIDETAAARTGVGEIVYAGPNVMMGYATVPSDLSKGHELDELRTGDLGRLDDEGRLEILGRVSRFVKLHGKRVDLDHLESVLAHSDRRVRCDGDDDGIVVVREATAGERAGVDDELRARVREVTALPEARIVAVRMRTTPRTSSGKVDGPALVDAARQLGATERTMSADRSVADTFALVLGIADVAPTSTFADLGGDSFSYVETSIRLERLIGDLPSDWHLTPVGELEAQRNARPEVGRFWTRLDTSVVIRAIAILLIVCTHMRLYRLAGGAHALLAVVGYNVARFQLLPHEVPGRLRRGFATVARVAAPTSLWIALNMLVAGGYSLGALLLINNYTGEAARRDGRWEYWYFETFVQVVVVIAILFAIPAVRRWERRAPFVFALSVLAATLMIRFDFVQLGGAYNEMFRTHTVACFVALGWCAQRADSFGKRLLVTGLVVLTTAGYFGQTDRELRVILMVTALIWLPTVLMPRPAAAVIGPLAAASMWIFLVHWQVWPLLTPWMNDGVAYWLTILTGVAVWWVARRFAALFGSRNRSPVDQRRMLERSTSNQVSDADTAIKSSDATPVSA